MALGKAMTVKLFVALRWVALTATRSVFDTTVVKTLVLGSWPATGVQVMMPLVSIVALVGPLVSAYVSGLGGTLGSVAVLVTTRVTRPITLWLCWDGRVGARFTSLTVTWKLLVSLTGGSSLS